MLIYLLSIHLLIHPYCYMFIFSLLLLYLHSSFHTFNQPTIYSSINPSIHTCCAFIFYSINIQRFIHPFQTFIHPSFCLSIHINIHVLICTSFYPSKILFIHPSIHPSKHPFRKTQIFKNVFGYLT